MSCRTTVVAATLVAAIATAGCGLGVESAVPDQAKLPETVDVIVDDSVSSEAALSTSTTSGATTTEPVESTTSITEAPTTESSTTQATTKASPTTTDPPTESGDSVDAEPELKFDFGAIMNWSGIGTDRVTIAFDRYQFTDGSQGPSLTQEVQLAGATDLAWRNENPRQRTYVLSPSVEALALDPVWLVEACAAADAPPARYMTVSVEEFVSKYTFAGLTFDSNGHVVRLRDQTSC